MTSILGLICGDDWHAHAFGSVAPNSGRGTPGAGYDYAAVHYGAGDGGTEGWGGGVEVFYLGGTTSRTFPADGSGPKGRGGICSVTLYRGDSPPVWAADAPCKREGMAQSPGLSFLPRLPSPNPRSPKNA
jgi:hypothetical protein